MKYFKPIIQFNDNTAAVALVKSQPDGIEYIYRRKKIDENGLKGLRYIVNLSSGRKLKDVLQNDISLLLFSNKLKKAVESKKLRGMSFHEIEVDVKKERFTPFWYVHLKFIPAGALDIKSAGGEVKDYHGTKIYSYIKPVLKHKILDELKLDYFRIPESKTEEFVSEKFKNIFEKNKFTGVEFIEIRTV